MSNITHLVSVIHGHGDTRLLEVEDVQLSGSRAVCRGVNELEVTGAWNNVVGRSVLRTGVSWGPLGEQTNVPGHRKRDVQCKWASPIQEQAWGRARG
jgi:hypothetical protein